MARPPVAARRSSRSVSLGHSVTDRWPGFRTGIACLVRPKEERLALAPQAQRLSHPGVRVDAPADPGGHGGAILRALHGTLSDRAGPGGCARGRSAGALVRSRVLQPGALSAPHGTAGGP